MGALGCDYEEFMNEGPKWDQFSQTKQKKRQLMQVETKMVHR